MNFFDARFRIFRVFGVTVSVHVLFLIYIAYRLFDPGPGGVRSQVVWLVLLFGIVLVHEFGHCFGARTVGGDARDIVMWPLGGLAFAHAPMRPWPQFVTVAAGPAVNVVFCLLSALTIFATTHWAVLPGINPLHPQWTVLHRPFPFPEWLDYVATFYEVNLFLLGFNLLPIYPLDGGQLLHAIIWPFAGLRRATLIAASVGLMGCAYFIITGIQGGGGGMLFYIGIFGGFTCWQQLQAARQGLLVEDSRFEAYYGPSHDTRSWWRRILRIRPRQPRPSRPTTPSANPNPGAWAARQEAQSRTEEELDQILKKVSERGIQSLSYVERQRLEQITRERQRQERQYQRDTSL